MFGNELRPVPITLPQSSLLVFVKHLLNVGARLYEQLDDQGRVFLRESEKNHFDGEARAVYLSPIFNWYRSDFEKQSGSVLKFLEPFLPAKDRTALAGSTPKIRYTDYDWSLNDTRRK